MSRCGSPFFLKLQHVDVDVGSFIIGIFRGMENEKKCKLLQWRIELGKNQENEMKASGSNWDFPNIIIRSL